MNNKVSNHTCFVYQNYCQGAQAYATIHASWQVQNVENLSLPQHWGQSKSVCTVIYASYIERYIFILSRIQYKRHLKESRMVLPFKL